MGLIPKIYSLQNPNLQGCGFGSPTARLKFRTLRNTQFAVIVVHSGNAVFFKKYVLLWILLCQLEASHAHFSCGSLYGRCFIFNSPGRPGTDRRPADPPDGRCRSPPGEDAYARLMACPRDPYNAYETYMCTSTGSYSDLLSEPGNNKNKTMEGVFTQTALEIWACGDLAGCPRVRWFVLCCVTISLSTLQRDISRFRLRHPQLNFRVRLIDAFLPALSEFSTRIHVLDLF